MGERQKTQVVKAAEQAAIAALAPQIHALRELALAEQEANEAPELRAEANRRAQQIRDDTEAEIQRRLTCWRTQYQATRAAGWSAVQLRSEPINCKTPPPVSKTRGRAARTTVAKPATVTAPNGARPVDIGPGPDA